MQLNLCWSRFRVLLILHYGDIHKMALNTALQKLDTLYYSSICFATHTPFHSHHSHFYWQAGPPPYPLLFIYKSIFPIYHFFFTSPTELITQGQVITSNSYPQDAIHLSHSSFRFFSCRKPSLSLTSLSYFTIFKPKIKQIIFVSF